MEPDNENNKNISDFDTTDEPASTPQTPADETGDRSAGDPSKTDEFQILQDKHLRLAAEFENYKRLVQRDQREYSRFANEQLLKELLPVVDNLERAIKSAKASRNTEALIHGVELTLKQFLEVLGKFGVRPISSVGQPFDPSRHEAVTRIESRDVPENTVVEECHKGYLLHERVLRPAMVAVSTGGTANDSIGTPEGETEERTMGFRKPGASA